MLARYRLTPSAPSRVCVGLMSASMPSRFSSTFGHALPRPFCHSVGASHGNWNMKMYHECASWPAADNTAAGVRLLKRSRNQWPQWSRHGPDTVVYDAMRLSAPGSVSASQLWFD